MFDIRPLLNPTFWFDTTPPPLGPFAEKFIFAFFAFLAIVGAVIRIVGTRRQEDKYVTATFNKLGGLFLTMGVIGVLIFFLTFERIPFLGARFWYLFWGIGFSVWFGMIIHYILKIVPKEKARQKEKEKFEKYLPKSKKKK